MKGLLSRLTPRIQFILVLVTELVLGVLYAGVIHIGGWSAVAYVMLDYLYALIHTVSFILAIVLALRFADGRRFYYMLPYAALLMAALFAKDVFINFYTCVFTDGLYANEAIVVALLYAAENTLLFTLLFLALVGSLGYLVFLYMRPRADVPHDMFALSSSHMLRAALFVTVMDILPKWLSTLVEHIIYLVRDVNWLPTWQKLTKMSADMILIPAIGIIAYLVAYASLKYTREKEKPITK